MRINFELGRCHEKLRSVAAQTVRRTREKYSVARLPWIDPAQKNVECAAEIFVVVVIR
mgnify:CR=1 FL=1